ncbi:MAG: hypothetical protein AAF985_17690, partial [Bacteroidota bacterium]
VEAYIAANAIEYNGTDLEKVIETSNALLLNSTDFHEYFQVGTLATSSMLAPLVDKFPDNMEAVITAGGASDPVQAKLTEFTNYFLDAMEGDEIVYADAYDYIIDFESSILSAKIWSSEDRERLLSATSIGRYSLYFWYHQEKTVGKGKGKVKGGNAEKRPWWNWLVIGVADVGGGIVGAGSGPAGAIGAGAAASNLANNLTKPDNK